MTGRTGKVAAFIAAGVALVCATAGVAYAVGSGGSGVITVCVHKHGGALYKAKRCAKGDSALHWNQVGEQGPPGQPGAQGTPGTSGEGPAYDASQSATPVDFSTGGSYVDVLTLLGLPPGSYAATGSLDVNVNGGTSGGDAYSADCYLEDGNGQFGQTLDLVGASTTARSNATIPVSLNVAFTATTADTVILACENDGVAGTVTRATNAEIQAVHVSAVNP